ncbi:transcription factor stalky-like isoform X2 [Colletes gigas]|nr:transcription factor stalky-like isoform X2 [Colletes gigas]
MSYEVEDEDIVTRVSSRMKKNLVSSTQHWVNTGYFPYSMYKKSDMCLKTCSRYKKVSSNLLHRRTIEEKSIKNDEKQRFCENSNTTSVDTMAYILSNMNRTNKVETMAIIEGAKHSISTNSQNVICENTELIKRLDKMSRKNCGDPVSNVNNNNNQICSFAPSSEKIKQEKNDLQKTRTALEKSVDTSINKILLLDTVKKGKELFHDSKSHSNKQFSENINVSGESNSDTQNSITKSLNTEQNDSIEKDPILQNSPVTVGHRRKLYSERRSPIDLVDMQIGNENITMSKLTQHLHSAIYTKPEVKKENRTSVISRSKNRFFVLNKNSEKNNNSLYTNSTVTDSSMTNQNLYIDKSLSTDVVCLRRLTENSESTFPNLLLGKPEIEYLSDNSSYSLNSIQICKCDNFDTSETYDDEDSIKSASIVETRTLRSDESETVCKDNHGNNVRIDSDQKCFLSDGDDEFTNIVQKYYTNW